MAARDVDANVSIVDAAPSEPMSPGRAGFVSAAHSSVLVVEPMAIAVRVAPPVGAAAFRDLDDRRIGAGAIAALAAEARPKAKAALKTSALTMLSSLSMFVAVRVH